MRDKPSTIGDYYDRVEQRRQKAIEKAKEAVALYHKHPTYDNKRAMLKANEDVIDAGNTGD